MSHSVAGDCVVQFDVSCSWRRPFPGLGATERGARAGGLVHLAGPSGHWSALSDAEFTDTTHHHHNIYTYTHTSISYIHTYSLAN